VLICFLVGLFLHLAGVDIYRIDRAVLALSSNSCCLRNRQTELNVFELGLKNPSARHG
jgi:hypothetical protein